MNTATPVACPKCGHARDAGETAPAWQCSACGIAYDKYHAYLERARKAVTPPHAGDLVPRWSADGSIWSLVIANGLALAIALHQGWTAADLMLIYWSQSVIIGIANFFRILQLDRFSTENFTINDRPVDPTTATKIQVAFFFAVHYGFFHLVYFMFLVVDPEGGVVLDGWFWLCAAVFAVNHVWSFRYNCELDRQGTPNIGTLMFTPYVRIVPMHLTIIFGGLFMNSAGGLLLFGILKTVADAGMHLAEHGRFRKVHVQIGGISTDGN